MTQKAQVKVELDTKQAKSDLRALGKEGERAAGQVNKNLSGGLGRAGALGAIAGAGFGLAQRAASRVSSAVPAVFSEGALALTAPVDRFFGGPEARAGQAARQETSNAFAEIVGRMSDPSVTPEMRNYFNNVKDLREITERGKSVIDQTLGMENAKSAVDNIVSSITEGFQFLARELAVGK